MDGAKVRHGGGGERLDLRALAHVRRDAEHLGAVRGEVGGDGRHGLGVEVGEHEVGAAGGEGAGERRADAAATAGHHGHAPREGVHDGGVAACARGAQA
jgi:hypothetical protein